MAPWEVQTCCRLTRSDLRIQHGPAFLGIVIKGTTSNNVTTVLSGSIIYSRRRPLMMLRELYESYLLLRRGALTPISTLRTPGILSGIYAEGLLKTHCLQLLEAMATLTSELETA